MGMGGQRHAPAALSTGKTRYALYRRLGRPQGRSGRVRKISPQPGFDPRTVLPLNESLYRLSNPGPLYSIQYPFILHRRIFLVHKTVFRLLAAANDMVGNKLYIFDSYSAGKLKLLDLMRIDL